MTLELAREFRQSVEGREALDGVGARNSNSVRSASVLPIHDPSTGEKPLVLVAQPDNGMNGLSDFHHGSGSNLDDIFIAGSLDSKTEESSLVEIHGDGGHDTVVLQGNPEDYHFSMPQTPLYYPSDASSKWETNESLYGQRVVVTNLKTGDQAVLVDIESIAFDPEKIIDSPRSAIENLPTILGNPSTISIHEAIRLAEESMTPEELTRAQIVATRQMNLESTSQGLFDDYLYRRASDEDIEARIAQMAAELEEAGIDLTKTYDTSTNAPIAPKTIESIGISTGSVNEGHTQDYQITAPRP